MSSRKICLQEWLHKLHSLKLKATLLKLFDTQMKMIMRQIKNFTNFTKLHLTMLVYNLPDFK